MPAIWGALGKGTLQRFIGLSVIDRLENLLPGLITNYDSDSLHEKEGLIQVFDSFFGAEALRQKTFRRTLFDSLPPELVEALAEAARLKSTTLTFEEKVEKLASKSWDDRAYAERASRVLDLPSEYLPSEAKPFVVEEVLHPGGAPYKPLKDYQFPIFDSAFRKLETPRSRFVIQMPTGSGKTRTAVEIICAFLNASPEGSVVVWLAHSEELCEQATDSFLEIWPHLARHDLRVLRCWGAKGGLNGNFPERAFIVGGFSKLHALLQRDPAPLSSLKPRVALIIVDEAHKVIAPTYEFVTRALINDATQVIGLTATPGRSVVDPEENLALAQFFFNELLSIQSGKKPVLQYLRDRGVLAHVDYEPLETHRSFELSAKDRAHFERFFDLPPGFLSKLGADDIRNVEIIKKIEVEAASNRRILFFACSVEHSKFICAILRFLGISAAHIDGSTPKPQRSATIGSFKTGSVRVLCNYGVLSTGFDAPQTDVVFVARPTSSIVLYSQMIGRGLRGPAIGGTESCKVIDVIDNIVGFSNENRLYEYFEEYFDHRR